MSSLQRYVLALSRIVMTIVFLLNGLGIINQAVAAKELIEHGAPASLVPFLMLSARTIEIVAGFSLALGIYIGFPFFRNADSARLLAGIRHSRLYATVAQLLPRTQL
jgi:hypothetical protein